MKHKFTSFIVLMMALATSQNVKAFDFSATLFGNTLYFEMITDSTCRIVCPTGNSNGPWIGYTQPSGMLQIPDEVYTSNGAYQITEIGSYAFAGTNITSLWITSNHLTKISYRAFFDCINMTSVNLIAPSLVDLGSGIFQNCGGLNTVVLPSNLCIIQDGMFQDCIQLQSIILPDSVMHIGGSAFKNTGLRSIIIPDKVSSVGVSAFADCSYLQTVTFGKSTKFIGQHSFNNCSNLQTIVSKPSNPPYFRTQVYSNYTYNVNLGGGYTDYACGDIPTSANIHIVCGKTSQYQSWWNTTNYSFIEDIVNELLVYSSDSTMGNAHILQTPSCPQEAIIMAQAYNGYHFVKWSDNNTDNPRTLSVTTDVSYTAIFEANSVTTNALIKMDSNIATLYALPQVGVQFKGWSDGAIENPHTVVVTSDTTVNAIYGALDSIRIYDTVTLYDTVINVMRDTTIYNHYFFDTVLAFDTLVVYDTTRVYDTLTVFNLDTVYRYYYDTTTFIYVDTLHHYYFDTTVLQNTIYDTTRVYDTLLVINIDTLQHYYYDTTVVQNIIYDTTRIYDTVTIISVDTMNHYYYDTTIVQNIIYDTTRIYNTLYDTTSITHYIYDSTWVYDTIYLVDTIHIHDTVYVGIDGVDALDVKIYSNGGQIVVEGAEQNVVTLFDISGRIITTRREKGEPLRFDVPATGTYLVKIGRHAARKIVVLR